MEWYRNFLRKNGVVGLFMTVYAVMYVVMILFLGIFGPKTEELMGHMTLSMEVPTFLREPWTLLSYWAITPPMFFWLLIVDLSLLYTFGNILNAMIGDRRTQGILFFSVLVNGIVTVALVNLLPTVEAVPGNNLFGLHTVNATLITAAITLVPRYEFRLIRWKVPLVYVGAVMLFVMLMGYRLIWTSMGVSLLVGMLVGFSWIKILRTGTDLTRWFQFSIGMPENNSPQHAASNRLRTRIKVVQSHQVSREKSAPPRESDQDRLDYLLDRINEVGFANLSSKEKEDLDRLSGS